MHTANRLDRANQAVWEKYEAVKDQPFRLRFHLMPPANWMNDPNGLIYFDGEYHVFYQHNPYGTAPGAMYWGHLSSSDMIKWQHRPIALAPDADYDVSCFSGSAIIQKDKLMLVYTSHDENRIPKEMQFLAESEDGVQFEKSTANPVLRQPPAGSGYDFRDPKVWAHGDSWYMVLGNSQNGHGRVLLYRSKDLIHWQDVGPALASNGSYGHMWECPDIYQLGDHFILAFSPIDSPISRNTLVIGDFDYETGCFNPIAYQEADYGEAFYAMQSMQVPDGRRVMIAWMEKWRDAYVTASEGWVGAMTLMREMKLENGHVMIRPVREMAELRQKQIVSGKYYVEPQKQGYLKNVRGKALEIIIDLQFTDEGCQQGGLRMRTSDDARQETLVYYDCNRHSVVCDRSHSGPGSVAETFAPVELGQNKIVSLQIFIDHSSIEVFINNGEAVITNRIYPDPDSTAYELYAVGGSMEVPAFNAWALHSIWPEPAN